jgi:hypothetical protein
MDYTFLATLDSNLFYKLHNDMTMYHKFGKSCIIFKKFIITICDYITFNSLISSTILIYIVYNFKEIEI